MRTDMPMKLLITEMANGSAWLLNLWLGSNGWICIAFDYSFVILDMLKDLQRLVVAVSGSICTAKM